MDILMLKLSTKFMKGIIAKLISKAIHNKHGFKIDIQFNELQLENHGGKIHIHANVDGEIEESEFKKIIKSAGLE